MRATSNSRLIRRSSSRTMVVALSQTVAHPACRRNRHLGNRSSQNAKARSGAGLGGEEVVDEARGERWELSAVAHADEHAAPGPVLGDRHEPQPERADEGARRELG